MHNSYFYILLLAYLLFHVTSCLDNVKHENPLDPHNRKSGFRINGKVNTYYPPFKPIPNAIISIHPRDIRVFSDSDGLFKIDELEENNYTIFCTAEGYNIDSLQINISEDKQIEFFLDGLPFFSEINLTTHHTSRFFPIDDMYFIEINTRVNDIDGIADISKVYFKIPEFNVSDTLISSIETGLFNLILSVEDLPVNTIHTLIGREMILNVRDDAGITVSSEPQFLTRIIDITPEVIQPTDLQTVANDTILFNWERIHLPYRFKYKIEIFQINFGLLTKVQEIENIQQDKNTFLIANTLTASDYVWILTVIDEFGNTSSSKEGTFQVNN